MITSIEQDTTDIEWFFTSNNEIGFVASGGGKLPISVSNKTIDDLLFLANYFSNLPYKSSIVVNPNLKALIAPSSVNEEYLSCFVKMAEKGLFSFDKTVLNNFSDVNYHLVAKPVNPLTFEDLPLDILHEILQTKIDGNIKASLNLSLIL